MALKRGQEKFDTNGDGRLTGREQANWYLHTYGVDLERAERRCKQLENQNLEQWLSHWSGQLCMVYDSALSSAKELAPAWSPAQEKLTGQAFLYALTSGVIEGGLWNRTVVTGSGVTVRRTAYQPFQMLVTAFSRTRKLPCSVDDIRRAALDRVPLFQEEGILQRRWLGRFWAGVISWLPRYSRDKIRPDALYTLFRAMRECRGIFRGGEDAEQFDREYDALMDCWQEYSLLHPDETQALDALRSWDAAHWDEERCECAERDLLMCRFPAEFRGLSIRELENWEAESELSEIYQKDPRLAIRMWRTLLDAAGPALKRQSPPRDDDAEDDEDALCPPPDLAELLVGEMFEVVDQPRALIPILDELEDDAFARQVFQSAYVGIFHENVLNACLKLGRTALRGKLLRLMDENPFRHEPLELDEPEPPQAAEPWCGPVPKAPAAPEYTGPRTILTYCTVAFPGGGRTYAYLTGGLVLNPGDWVLVPFGPTGAQRKGQIREVLRCLPENAPWPPQLTKTVLGRAGAPGQ